MVEEADKIGNMIAEAVVCGGRVTQPVAALIVGDDAVVRQKLVDDLVPDACVGPQ
jgi:hypothetical protein